MSNILDRFYPEKPFKPERSVEIIKTLNRIYGEYLLSKILKCKTGMIRRALDGRPVFTSRQISIINLLLLIEEQIAEKSTGQPKKSRGRKTA